MGDEYADHELDGREETLERLEAAARERWGEKWAIRATHFADGTTQAYAFRSRGVVDDDRDEKTLEQERLYVSDEKAVFRRVHLHHEDVVDVLEEREFDHD
ncbi:hypothetical protein [Natrinema salsiterrestre]|uniref:Uncharacterized protein n=1 Tax=Natrinema salsiterrestre TaxID=2950540 RepID=A0A9Q4Q5B7_9EURY|nr:hypothetical protein [Natrinema salsiterrestre]MDF9748427.1 hypothetical protein [Natrinema salsiterrestre]